MTLGRFNEETGKVLRLRRAVIRRDHQKCVRCKKSIRYKDANVIRISPKGHFDYKNLITSCHDCKEWLEANGALFKTKAEVENSFVSELTESITHGAHETPAWHAWVYGSARIPGTKR